MKVNTIVSRLLVAAAFLTLTVPVVPQVVSSDVITVGSASGVGGSVVDVPIYIRDVSTTPLGIDQPAGSRIQSLSITINYPAASVTGVSISRAGITAPLTPTFESTPASPGAVTLLVNFNEATNLIPFVSNAAAPGNLVAHLLVTLAPGVTPGTTIPLTFDTVLTQLTDAGGNPATVETVANGRLTVVNGAIAVGSFVPTLGTWSLILLTAALAFVAMRTRLS